MIVSTELDIPCEVSDGNVNSKFPSLPNEVDDEHSSADILQSIQMKKKKRIKLTFSRHYIEMCVKAFL